MTVSETISSRIEIVGDWAERGNGFDYCRDNGYHIIRSGGVPMGHGKIDVTRFLIIAERVAIGLPKSAYTAAQIRQGKNKEEKRQTDEGDLG